MATRLRKSAPAKFLQINIIAEDSVVARTVHLRTDQTIRQFKERHFAKTGVPDQIHLVWTAPDGRPHTITEREGADIAKMPLVDQFDVQDGDLMRLYVVRRCES